MVSLPLTSLSARGSRVDLLGGSNVNARSVVPVFRVPVKASPYSAKCFHRVCGRMARGNCFYNRRSGTSDSTLKNSDINHKNLI